MNVLGNNNFLPVLGLYTTEVRTFITLPIAAQMSQQHVDMLFSRFYMLSYSTTF